jgi:16S rRNA (cytosine1402-N4)-methyltransferase
MSGAMASPYEHQPVMVTEVVELLSAVPSGIVVDATVGGGGHARAVLEARPDIELLGLDRDEDAVVAASTALAGFGDRVTVRHARFDELTTTVEQLGHAETQPRTTGTGVVGVLFDLGVSSPQLDRPERGFSYRDDGPLDMRMDQQQALRASDVVNGYGEAELARVLHDLGDERFAGRIARAIVAARPLQTTGELVDVIRSAIPAPARRRGGHPAKRTFQAIRIEVNGELEVLDDALGQAIDVLVPGGRAVVLSYHSGEDRIVKRRFRDAASGNCICPPGMPCVCGAQPTVRLIGRSGKRPSAAEVARNRRSESARLRVVERLPEPEAPEGDDAA